MKTFHTTVLAVAALIASTSALAQIPVTDLALNGQTMANQVATMAQWAQQIAEMKSQFDQMEKEYAQMERDYEAVTGSRGLGNIMNDHTLRDYLPADWQGVYDNVRNGGYARLTGRGASVYNANKIFDSCQSVIAGDQRTACEARAVKASQDKGFALDAYDAAESRIKQIDQLMGKINETQDPKAIAELQGRIAAEQANIQNEQTKLQLYAMVAAAEDRVQQQRQHELNAKDNARRGWVRPQTVQLGN